MKYLLVALLLSAIPAHATDLDIPKHHSETGLNNANMATPTCEIYVEWTGRNISEIDLSILGDRSHRIIKPNSMVTMDYQPERLNINTTPDGIILTQECG